MTRRVHHEPSRAVTLAPTTGPIELPTHHRSVWPFLVAIPGLGALGMLATYIAFGAP